MLHQRFLEQQHQQRLQERQRQQELQEQDEKRQLSGETENENEKQPNETSKESTTTLFKPTNNNNKSFLRPSEIGESDEKGPLSKRPKLSISIPSVFFSFFKLIFWSFSVISSSFNFNFFLTSFIGLRFR